MKSKSSRNRKAEKAEAVPQTETQAQAVPKLTRMLDIPSSALMGLPQLEISGNREVVVDGCQGVLEYDETVVKLAANKMSIKFTGRGLQIKVLTHDGAVVTGFITSIEFMT